jgi:hypothetical protein
MSRLPLYALEISKSFVGCNSYAKTSRPRFPSQSSKLEINTHQNPRIQPFKSEITGTQFEHLTEKEKEDYPAFSQRIELLIEKVRRLEETKLLYSILMSKQIGAITLKHKRPYSHESIIYAGSQGMASRNNFGSKNSCHIRIRDPSELKLRQKFKSPTIKTTKESLI